MTHHSLHSIERAQRDGEARRVERDYNSPPSMPHRGHTGRLLDGPTRDTGITAATTAVLPGLTTSRVQIHQRGTSPLGRNLERSAA